MEKETEKRISEIEGECRELAKKQMFCAGFYLKGLKQLSMELSSS